MSEVDDSDASGYRHRQFATVRYVALFAVAFLLVSLMFASNGHPLPTLVLLAVIALAALSHTLTIEIDDQSIGWSFRPRFGRWQLQIASIERVQIEPAGAVAHLGIVKTRRGWLYASAPGDCAAIRTIDGREVFLGTNDAANLVRAINAAREAVDAGAG